MPHSRPVRLIRSQWFSLTLVAAFIVSWLLPQVGVAVNRGGHAQYWAIVVIFLVSGLVLPTREALAGLLNWRAHLFIQLFSFVLIPLVAWLVLWPLRGRLEPGLLAGLYLLAALPTTISSCVVFTQLSGGNTATALFNATAGNMAGILVTPALLFLMLGNAVEVDIDSLEIAARLARQVILPFFIGQGVHLASGGRTGRRRRLVATINSLMILLIVYTAFSEMFADQLMSAARLADPWLVGPLALLLPAHLLIVGAAGTGARLLCFGRPERIAVLFTASQKTLSLGLPLASATLGSDPRLLGLAILPMLVHHPIQLITAGFLKDWLGRRGRP